jgi:hypothetical protein
MGGGNLASSKYRLFASMSGVEQFSMTSTISGGFISAYSSHNSR